MRAQNKCNRPMRPWKITSTRYFQSRRLVPCDPFRSERIGSEKISYWGVLSCVFPKNRKEKKTDKSTVRSKIPSKVMFASITRVIVRTHELKGGLRRVFNGLQCIYCFKCCMQWTRYLSSQKARREKTPVRKTAWGTCFARA